MKKKVLLGMMLSTALFTMAGCNDNKNENKEEKKEEQKVETKRLICSSTEDGETIRYTLTYEGNTYNKAAAMSTTKYKSESATKKAYDKLVDDIKKDNSLKGVSANAQYSGTSVTVSYTFTIADLEEDGKKLYEETGLKELDGKSYDDAKSLLETAQFKCN